MKKFKVHTSYDGRGVYTVMAKDKADAEERFSDCHIDYQDDIYDPEHNSNEEVLKIEEVL